MIYHINVYMEKLKKQMKHSVNLYGKHVQNLHLYQKNLQIAVRSAAINFNLGLSDVYHVLEITLGQRFYKIATKRDSLRIAK